MAACRSGTKYIHEVLKSLGVNCGHETVYSELGYLGWANYQVDVSCWSPYYFKREHGDDINILHQTRNPVDSINSNASHWEHFLNDLFSKPNESILVQIDHQNHPRMAQVGTPLEKAVVYYTGHNSMIEERHSPVLRYAVEGMTLETVKLILSYIDGVVGVSDARIEEVLSSMPKDNNPLPDYVNRGMYNYTFNELPDIQEKSVLATLIQNYGY